MTDRSVRLNAALEGRYNIERELGEGGMATVYLADDLRHDRKVALKVLKPELAAALGSGRFLREIRLTANLHHPHILPLYDSGDAGGALFYVTPLVRGESLRERLDREKMLPVDDAVRIVEQVAGALDFAHREGVVHRDIKPANILLQDGEALLADFGIAIGPAGAAAERLTATGVSVGTPAYMSPEQAAGEPHIDARSDIYSLGAVAYEMLVGEPPVTGATPQAMLGKLMTERPTPLHVVRDGVPAHVDAAVTRALAKAPVDRFATARDFAGALSSPLSGHGLATHGAERTVRRRRVAAVGLAVTVAAGLGALAWYGPTLRSASDGASGASPEIRSIAVLPLDNYSGDPAQDYFAEGMTDELTAALATISELRVTSRGSAMQFQGRSRPATPQIAEGVERGRRGRRLGGPIG